MQINMFKKLLPKSLLMRFVLIIVLPVVVGQIIAVQVFYYRHWYNVSNHSSRFIIKEIKTLIKDIENDKIDKGDGNEMEYYNLHFVYRSSSSLPNIPEYRNEELKIFMSELQNSLKHKFVVDLLDRDRKIELFAKINSTDVLQIIIPAKALINPSAFIFILWFVVTGLLLLLITLLFTKNQIKSIVELSKAADLYGRGLQIKKFKPSGATEIRQAGFAFLKMKDRIERQVAKRTQMLAMISHDLKTPLTRMKLRAELMEEGEDKAEFKYDIDVMQKMIASYLDFSRGEGGEKFEVVEINSWLENYFKTNWPRNVVYHPNQTKYKVQIKPLTFTRALANLIENAIKHSEKIEINVETRSSSLSILIDDDGPGISDEEKRNVFKPFFRGDKARALDSSGSVGLGMAISNEIIRGHFGSITLHNSIRLGGLQVKIVLPKYRSYDGS